MREDHYDVAIIGGGLAGLTLARHLLLHTDKTVLLLERRTELPPTKQKYGESTVQLAGYYYSKVLDMEEHMWCDQIMKYNLRFYWPSTARDNSRFEDFTQLYIRQLSNIVSHQLDRNVFEGELLRRNLADPRFTLRLGVTDLDADLAAASAEASGAPHALRCRRRHPPAGSSTPRGVPSCSPSAGASRGPTPSVTAPSSCGSRGWSTSTS
jgi:2-polyprenyl-6-methoxyphenol hydroxylase-like FAD-dependent oxidoreductase